MAQQFGLGPRNQDTLNYQGSPLNFVPTVEAPRDPINATDLKYPIQTIWRNTASLNEWILTGFSSGLAQWKMFTFGSVSGITSLTGNSGGAVGPNNGNINVVGDGTTCTVVGTPLANTLTISLIPASPAVTTIQGDDSIQVIPTAGVIGFFGAVVANATHAKPVYFLEKSATTNTEELDVQVTTTSSSAAKNINKAGLASFDSTFFTVDSGTGWVSLSSSGNITGVIPDAHTNPGSSPVIPNGSGNITVTGGQVAAGTTSNVIQTNSLAANTYTIQIQRSQAVASSTVGDNGVSHFNSANFTVDSNGFVSARGGSLAWQTISANQTLVVNNGYICISPGGTLALALPATATIGDIIEITVDGATAFQVTQAAGQQIRFGNTQTTSGAGGSLTSIMQGDTIRMVAQSATRWNVLSSLGNITVV